MQELKNMLDMLKSSLYLLVDELSTVSHSPSDVQFIAGRVYELGVQIGQLETLIEEFRDFIK